MKRKHYTVHLLISKKHLTLSTEMPYGSNYQMMIQVVTTLA